MKYEKRYSFNLFLPSAVGRSGCSTSRPGLFTPEKETRYPSYKKLNRSQCRSGEVQKISPHPAFDPRTDKPVASRKWCRGETEVATRRRNCPSATETTTNPSWTALGSKLCITDWATGSLNLKELFLISVLSVLISWIWLIIKYLEEPKLIVFLNCNKTAAGTNSTN